MRNPNGAQAADRDGRRRAVAARTRRGRRRLDSRAGEPIRAGQGRRPVPLHRHAARRSERHLPARAAARAARACACSPRGCNHDDARSINSIDTYVEEDGRHYIRHYLQDFGSNLGSGSTSAQQPRGGYEYLIEGDKIAKGLVVVRLLDARPGPRCGIPTNPSLGNIEADFFEPWKWKTEYPQPAFDQMDAADAFWAASIASRFTDDDDQGDRRRRASSRIRRRQRYLTDVIIKRRDKVVAYWISRTNPLDRFEVQRSGSGVDLTFDNAAVRLRVAQPGATYAVRWFAVDNLAGTDTPAGEETQVKDGRAVRSGFRVGSSR